MIEIIDLADKLQEKKIEDNKSKNERYLVRNEIVKLVNFISQYDLEKHGLIKLKDVLVDNIINLNNRINRDNGNDRTEVPPSY